MGSGLPQKPVRLWLSHCRLDVPQTEGAAVTPRVLRPVPRPPCPAARPSGHAPTASLPRPVQARTCAQDDITPKHLATPRPSAFYTAFHWVCQTLDKNVKGKTIK